MNTAGGGGVRRNPTKARAASVILPAQQWATLDGLAAQFGVSRADVVRWAISDYLDRVRSGAAVFPARVAEAAS